MADLLVWLMACASPADEGAVPVLDGPGFFDRPFPSDTRRVDGHPDLTGFPHEGEYPLVDAYLAAGARLDGFGTNSPFFVRFESPLDEDRLPDAAASLDLDSPVLLLDVDPASPHRGERTPLQFQVWTDATRWTPENLLAVAPVYGFPLRPHTRYAVVMRPPLVARGAMGEVWGYGADPDYADIENTLLGLGLDPAEVALAVPFTTQDPAAEMERITRTIWEEITLPSVDPHLDLVDTRSFYTFYQGEVTIPLWQAGERPYHETGGGFAFDADGAPILTRWERVAFALSVPLGAAPAAGWPVVVYAHGTGGDYQSFGREGANDEEATVLAREGVAVFGISQPLHGDRATPDTGVDFDSFNVYNPDAGRSNFRQGALDQVFLARLLSEGVGPLEADGTTISLDPTRIGFFGHSQGGLVGALAAPYFRDHVRVAGFSGTGGVLSLTVVLRKDPFDFAALVEALLGFEATESLSPLHPVTGLVQTLVEVTDPVNYAAWWFAEAPPWPAAPLPILLTEGLLDAATPPSTTEALAGAGRVPQVGEAVTDPEALALRGLGKDVLPAQGNTRDWESAAITAGLAQFEDQDHYAIYNDTDARRLYRDFLASGLVGTARLEE